MPYTFCKLKAEKTDAKKKDGFHVLNAEKPQKRLAGAFAE